MPELGTSTSLTALVDLNVWLALAYDGHVHHLAAVSWFEKGEGENAAFCRRFGISLSPRAIRRANLNQPSLEHLEPRQEQRHPKIPSGRTKRSK